MLVAFSGWGIQSKNTNVLILIHFQKNFCTIRFAYDSLGRILINIKGVLYLIQVFNKNEVIYTISQF